MRAAQIARRIKELALNNKRKEMGEAIQKKVENKFGWQGIIQKYKDLYESL